MILQLFSGSWLQTCLISLVAGLVVYWIIQKRKYNLPPGPFALPLLGNALQMNNKFLHEKIFKEWSKKYGPVVSVRFGPMLMIFVNNIECAMEVLVKKSTDFAGRYQLPSMDHFTSGGKDIALANYGPTWKLQRKIASKALRHYMQGNALETRIHEAVEIGFREMEKETGPFNPKEYINFIIGNILTGLCFGGRYEFDNKEVHTILEMEDKMAESFTYGILEDFVPGLRFVYKTKAFKKMEEFTKIIIDDFVAKKFREEVKTFDKGNVRHFTDTLLLARLEAQEEGGAEELKNLTDMHLIQTCSDIFFAGVDTTRLTLRYAILHMMAFPDIQEKVQEEIDRVVGRDRLPGMADRADLGYTEAVLHESMRLSSVAPIGLAHMTTCDTELAGYKIPKGTQVAINHWALHHDPDAWKEVNRFMPERYLDENGKLGPKPDNWLPFSAGKRVCLGEFVAKPELHLLFASLMQRFTWKPISGIVPDISPDGGMAVGLFPKEYKVIIKKRI